MITTLLEGNERFVRETFETQKAFFADLAKKQRPTVLWIGCSDSRVAVNTITGTQPGEIFTHRNVANIVATNDWNLSAVLEFSLNHLHIPDIVICGHYGCGGIEALDNMGSDDKYIPVWLINAARARTRVDELILTQALSPSREERLQMMVEENVRLQIEHLREYPFVREAIAEGRLKLHGWVYDMESGHIRVICPG